MTGYPAISAASAPPIIRGAPEIPKYAVEAMSEHSHTVRCSGMVPEAWATADVLDACRDRFWAKVDVGSRDECWPWKPTLHTDDYGLFSVKGRLQSAIRVAYALSYPDDPLWRRSVICHRCDNRPCVNPYHLWQGTYAANTVDKLMKGRAKTKVTDGQVVQIRALALDQVPTAEIAERFGISGGHVSQIVRRISRKLVT